MILFYLEDKDYIRNLKHRITFLKKDRKISRMQNFILILGYKLLFKFENKYFSKEKTSVC